MVTGDNLATATAVAIEAGILAAGGGARGAPEVMTGPYFRTTYAAVIKEVTTISAKEGTKEGNGGKGDGEGANKPSALPLSVARDLTKLRVLARSSPADKHALVSLLKRLGEVVGVTGDGINDAPALKVKTAAQPVSVRVKQSPSESGPHSLVPITCALCVHFFEAPGREMRTRGL